MLRLHQIKLKPEIAAQLGPMGRVRKKKQIALHANLMAASGPSSKAKTKAALRAGQSRKKEAGK